jgi:hypothetical protein
VGLEQRRVILEKGKDFRAQLENENSNNDDKMALVDGFDEAIIGHTDSWNGAPNGKREFKVGRPHRAVYDRARCILILEEKNEINREEAEQCFESEVVWNVNYHWQDGPVFVEVFKRRNLNIGRGEDLRSLLDELVASGLEGTYVIRDFDDAIVGYTDSFMGMDPSLDAPDDEECTNSRPIRMVYDRDMCIRTLAKRNGVILSEAVEDFESKMAGEYVGAHTPLFVSVLKRRKIFQI